MPILQLSEFKLLKPQLGDANARAVFGLDYGSKRIGVSISDRSWMIATPFIHVDGEKFTKAANQIFDEIEKNKIIGLVVGLPLQMDGSEGKSCQAARQFARNLLKIKDIPITFFDERFSSVAAERMLTASELSYQKKKAMTDQMASAYFLQSFLDYCGKN